ncbi:MAG TPA: heme o synthase [candidate division Zixibacteria bacterium]|nr:heme o synthase [candidate division Zixibacteria bacterium]
MSTVTQPLAVPRSGAAAVARDFSELIKIRVTSLIVMSAWCGFYFGAAKSGMSSVSFTLLHALLGIGMVSGGTAAMNEVVERESDALMRRTQRRPLVTQSMSVGLATATALFLIFGGAAYLAIATNALTAALSLATSAVYLLAYTPLKKISPICTFVGAFPGAMPAVLGWTAVRGRLDWEAFVLFAIMFFWQFPHFHSIALLYREDYERAGIRMLPVVERDGRSTARAILLYGAALLPTTLMPTLLGMSGIVYLVGASLLGLGLFYYCVRIWKRCLPVSSAESKMLARGLLKATVFYLPLLFALMMINSAA